MAIASESTCEYEATVEQIDRCETIWKARELSSSGTRLAGREPRICIDSRRIALTAASARDAAFRQVVVPAGDAIFRSVRAGDMLYLTRTSGASFGVSLVRRNRLVVAFGAVTSLELGSGTEARRGPNSSHPLGQPLDDTWLDVSVDGRHVQARERDNVRVNGYDIYVERSWNCGIPGIEALASISLASVEGLAMSAARSAILLANADAGTKWRAWDGEQG